MILIVCHGNVNRSAAAHIILAHYSLDVDSAGFVNPGRPMAKKMRLALTKRGYDQDQIEAHRSKLANKTLIAKANLTFFMDMGNMRRLLKLAPEHQSKFRCLAHYLNPPGLRIPDPGFMAKDSKEFRQTVELIVQASIGLVEQLTKSKV